MEISEEWADFERFDLLFYRKPNSKYWRIKRKSAIIECFVHMTSEEYESISTADIRRWLYAHYNWLKAEDYVYAICQDLAMEGIIELAEIRNNQRRYRISKREIKYTKTPKVAYVYSEEQLKDELEAVLEGKLEDNLEDK